MSSTAVASSKTLSQHSLIYVAQESAASAWLLILSSKLCPSSPLLAGDHFSSFDKKEGPLVLYKNRGPLARGFAPEEKASSSAIAISGGMRSAGC